MACIDGRFSQRPGVSALGAPERAAAYLVDAMAELMVVTDGYTQQGEAEPEWLGRCQELLQSAFAQLVPEVAWEHLVMLAGISSRDIPR